MNDPKSIIEPIAGYLLDSIAKLRGDVYVPHSLTKLQALVRLRRVTGATTVIEVGSYKGVTTRRLSRFFEQVLSIEIDPELCEHARRRCSTRRNVTIYQGDGKVLLPQLAATVRNCVLFLDGHFSGDGTGHGDEPEPVLAELDVVSPWIGNFVGLVVDDFRLFGVERGWPRKSEVMAALEQVLPAPQWRHAVLDDQFVAMRVRGR